MKKLTNENKNTILGSGKVVLKFSASWCGPCQSYNRILEDLDEDFPIYAVDVEVMPEAAQQFGVRGIPTTIYLEDGVVKTKLVGVQSLGTIKNLIA